MWSKLYESLEFHRSPGPPGFMSAALGILCFDVLMRAKGQFFGVLCVTNCIENSRYIGLLQCQSNYRMPQRVNKFASLACSFSHRGFALILCDVIGRSTVRASC